jgi:two-component system, cell cycle sensor histidine kinase and response regulator CckA
MKTDSQWRSIFDAMSDAVCILDASHVILRCNKAMTIMFGKSEAEILGKYCWEVVHGIEGAYRDCPVLVMEKTLRRESLDMCIDDKWFQVTADPILDESGKLTQTVHIVRDITSQKQSEIELKQAAERFRSMIDNAPYGAHLYELMPNGQLIFIGANKSADQILGIDNDLFVGKTIEEAFPNLIQTEVPDAYRKVAQCGQPFNTEQIIYADDKGISGVFEVCAFQTGHSKMAALFRDITEKKQAQDKLRRSQEEIYRERERLTVTLRSIGDGVITTDTSGRVTFMNPIAEITTGWSVEEAIGKPLSEVFRIINEITRQPCENPVEKVLKTGVIVELANHTVLISRDGREIVLADSGSPIKDEKGNAFGVILVFRDVTEKQQMLDALQRSQKLDSLGVLAGGIAHDFNNLLGGIFGFIDLARCDRNLNKKTADYLDSSMQVLSRAKGLTQQLLTFSKGGAPIRKTGAVEKMVREVAQFVLSGSNVAASFSVAPGLWNCEFDENQICQVIDNIVINALQAMPLGGTIDVTMENCRIGEEKHDVLKSENYVRISIRDSGIGIPREIITRIFDPFFTTKQKGHGLGLATAYSIIRKHDGAIDVESEPGKGSVFHIYLPASSAMAKTGDGEMDVTFVGGGRILVMDDEQFIRDTVEAMLTAKGYETLCAKDGQEALNRFDEERSAGRTIDAIICDLTVPGGLGGKEIVGVIRKKDTLVPIIVSSGYSEDPVMANPKDYGFSASIAKPFTLKELHTLLYSLLHKR